MNLFDRNGAPVMGPWYSGGWASGIREKGLHEALDRINRVANFILLIESERVQGRWGRPYL